MSSVSGESGAESIEIELGLQGKMIELGIHFQQLQFDEATQGGEEVIGLGGDGLGRGLGQRDVLFERLVITSTCHRCDRWW